MQTFSVYKRKKDKRRKDRKWIIAWTDENDRRRTMTAFTDYEASLELARKLAKEAAMIKVGRQDPFEVHRKRPIGEHIDDFIESLRSRDRAPRYVRQVEKRIRTIIDALEVKHLQDLDPVAVDKYLVSLKRERGHSGITKNEYTASIKAFTKWAVTYRRMPEDVLAGLKQTERSAIERVHPRRALTVAEISRLLDAAAKRPETEVRRIRHGKRKGQLSEKVKPVTINKVRAKGRERRMVYLIAVWTGLRRKEIRQLRWSDINLDVLPAHIKLRAAATKSKRADILPVHPQLAAELRAFKLEGDGEDAPVVSCVPHMKTLRADLEFAGISYMDEQGRYVDFHSLRTSFCTMLAAKNVPPRMVQALMRHTDPRLTAMVYTDERVLPLAGELSVLPGIPGEVETSRIEKVG